MGAIPNGVLAGMTDNFHDNRLSEQHSEAKKVATGRCPVPSSSQLLAG